MTTAFPTGLDDFTNPDASTDDLDTTGVEHDDQHANANDAIEALEAKVGIDGSAVATSLDKRIAVLEAATAIKTVRTVRLTAQNIVNPTPTSDTLIPGMTITVPASASSRTVILSFSLHTGSHSNRVRVYMDGSIQYPASGSGGNIGATNTDTDPGIGYSVAGVPITIPGDSATHTIEVRWQAQGTTAQTVIHDRAMTILDPL